MGTWHISLFKLCICTSKCQILLCKVKGGREQTATWTWFHKHSQTTVNNIVSFFLIPIIAGTSVVYAGDILKNLITGVIYLLGLVFF